MAMRGRSLAVYLVLVDVVLISCGGDVGEPTSASAAGGSSAGQSEHGRSEAGGADDMEARGGAAGSQSDQDSLTDFEVSQTLIDASIEAYDGQCPCPYSLASDSSECGGRSAYSRPGGEMPLCFPEDVTDEMVQAWRAEHPGD